MLHICAVTRYRRGLWQHRWLTTGNKYSACGYSRHGRILRRGRPGPDDSLRHHSGNDRRSPGRHPNHGRLDAWICHVTRPVARTALSRPVTQFHRCSCGCQTLNIAFDSQSGERPVKSQHPWRPPYEWSAMLQGKDADRSFAGIAGSSASVTRSRFSVSFTTCALMPSTLYGCSSWCSESNRPVWSTIPIAAPTQRPSRYASPVFSATAQNTTSTFGIGRQVCRRPPQPCGNL